jgi:DNA-binding MarR family transcriptional regulator
MTRRAQLPKASKHRRDTAIPIEPSMGGRAKPDRSEASFELPATVGRPELLIKGSDGAFREFIYDLNFIGTLLERLKATLSSHFGLTGAQFHMLMVVAQLDHDTPVTVGRVAAALHASGPFATREAAHLAAAGFLKRAKNPLDGREVHLTLTAKGKKAATKAASLLCFINDRAFRSLSKTEFEALLRIIKALRADLSDTLKMASEAAFARE